MDYGERLRRIREKRGISRYRASKISGIPESTIRNWEMEGRTPPIDAYEQVLNAIGYELIIKKGESND